jgi:hypothetical protein
VTLHLQVSEGSASLDSPSNARLLPRPPPSNLLSMHHFLMFHSDASRLSTSLMRRASAREFLCICKYLLLASSLPHSSAATAPRATASSSCFTTARATTLSKVFSSTCTKCRRSLAASHSLSAPFACNFMHSPTPSSLVMSSCC